MFEQAEFAKRRAALLEQVDDNSIVLLSGENLVPRNNDCDFPFRQNSDFFYLTGFNEPQAFMVLLKKANQTKFILFNREKNYQEELWDGIRVGQQAAVQDYGADEAYSFTELEKVLPTYLADKSKVYYQIGFDEKIDTALPKWIFNLKKQVRKGVAAPTMIEDISDVIAEMRLIKSKKEIDVLRRICKWSAQAHIEAMKAAPESEYEYQLLGAMQADLMRKGCLELAYGAIVAGGKNACILHYTDNNQAIGQNDLVLIDVGGELENYAADITRTFPRSGHFSDPQKAIYEIVLKAQKAGVEMIKPGLSWVDIQKKMVLIISQGLIDVGILEGDIDTVIEEKKYSAFYMHNSGHWLGLDVHDSGRYKIDGEWRQLHAGMVLTVEPGIYIAAHHDVDPKWHNIGIRIEDDILVTEEGYENLTQAVPKDVHEIEALMQS